MRYLVGLMPIFAMLVLPLSASAQDVEADASSEPNLQEPAPSTEPAPEEPALQLQLDDAGVEVTPTPEGFYIVEPTGAEEREMELRVRRARIGVGVSAAALVLGAVVAGAAGAAAVNRSFSTPTDTSSGDAAVWVGVALVGVGGVSMIATGILLGVRKRKLRELQEARYETPRRVQWDLARSRLVF